MTRNHYKEFAQYYDIYGQGFDYDIWFRYLQEISSINDFSGKEILDLGCGTGNLLVKFAKKSANVTGVDLSNEMLSITADKLHRFKNNALLIQKDIAVFKQDKKFDFIYSTCDTVNYLSSESFLSMLRNVSDMLSDGAVFTFDLLNQTFFEQLGKKDNYVFDSVKFKFKRKIEDNKLITNVRIIDGKTRFSEEHIQFFLDLDMIKKAINEYELKLYGIFDIYSFEPATNDSEKFQIILQKT